MGLEIALGVASLAVGVISGVNQFNAANQSAALAKQSAEAQKESNNIRVAQQTIISLEDRRQRIREERIRRASMLAASENAGTKGSSGETGGISALRSNFGTLLSGAAGQTKANIGINEFNQKALDLDTEARSVKARADAFSDFLGIFQSSFSTLGSIFEE